MDDKSSFHWEAEMLHESERKETLLFKPSQSPMRMPAAERCVLAHDLNNCLGAILLQCDVLTDLISNNTEALAHLTVVRQLAKRMATDIDTRLCPITPPK